MRQVILLTGCINPNGMGMTLLTDPAVREQQYRHAIEWYLQQTRTPIVFVENSGTPITLPHHPDRLETLSFEGNEHKEKGKGYGEMEAIAYALQHSRLITPDSVVTKITGRLIIKNIRTLLRLNTLLGGPRHVRCQLSSDLRFADSRILTAPASFLLHLTSQKEKLNDTGGYYFEHLLADNLRGHYLPYPIRPAIYGESGTNGTKYAEEDTTLLQRLRYLRYQLYLYRKEAQRT